MNDKQPIPPYKWANMSTRERFVALLGVVGLVITFIVLITDQWGPLLYVGLAVIAVGTFGAQALFFFRHRRGD